MPRGGPASSWEVENLAHLKLALDAVFAEIAAAGATGRAAEEHQRARDAARATAQTVAERMSSPPALRRLETLFALSPFESQTLVLSAAWELERSTLQPLIGRDRNDAQAHPTFGIAMSVLDGAHWSACTRDSPLRRWSLLHVDPGESLLSARLHIDEHMLHFLKGVPTLDTRLERLSAALPTIGSPTAAQRRAIDLVMGRQPRDDTAAPDARLLVGRAADCRAVAAGIGAALGLPARVVRASRLPTPIDELETVLRVLERDTILGLVVPLLQWDGSEPPDCAHAIAWMVEHATIPLLVTAPEPIELPALRVRRIAVGAPTLDERRRAWREGLGAVGTSDDTIDTLVAQFRLDPPDVADVCAAIAAVPKPRGVWRSQVERLWSACVDRVAPQLDGLAQRVPARDAWRELVLAPPQVEVLKAIAAHVRQRGTVDLRWAMRDAGARGAGVSVLFAGPSGTGKTLAAEALAFELRLPLFRIDLSSVVSKWIGETEKHLRRLFDAADAGGVVLLFDEADAIFGKRSAVGSAHDRYANIEVSYLLQRLETYTGLAVLTTNHQHHLDPAFLRRFRFVVNFLAPGPPQRRRLWERALPATHAEELDYDALARLDLTGANIRNVALIAASHAADAHAERVTMEHVLMAARLELAKLQKPMPVAG